MECPTENTWLALLGGELAEPARAQLDRHVDRCQTCRLVYAEVARRDPGPGGGRAARDSDREAAALGADAHPSLAHPGGASEATAAAAPTPRSPASTASAEAASDLRTGAITVAEPRPADQGASLAPGTRLGRYVVVDTLGRGGMSVVYKAFDSKLDRLIALKLVRGADAHDPAARDRLVREAKLLAQLAHPHVVAVHDVGSAGGEQYLAMELVVGVTLRTWLRARPRRAAEVLELLRAAGSGLAAAHRLQLVHRDFKPENVLVGDDGRPRVADFGLAHPIATRDGGSARGGGTPAYMSPEQDAGHELDARSDQYSFCTVVFEALYGQRPFAGPGGYRDLVARRRAGALHFPAGAVPARVRRALARGLAPDPAARFPHLEELLRELGAERWPRAARAAVGATAAAALAAGGWGAWAAAHPAPTIADRCALAADDADRVWRADRRVPLIARWAATRHPGAAAAAASAADAFDGWIADWRGRRIALCEQTMRADASPTDAAAHLACLRERLTAIDAAITMYTHGALDAQVRHSAELLRTVDRTLPRCDRPAPRSIDDELRARWTPVLTELVASHTALGGGDVAEARRRAASALARARALGEDAPLAAALEAVGTLESEAAQAIGSAAERAPAMTAARATLSEAATRAARARADADGSGIWLALLDLALAERRADAALDAYALGAEIALAQIAASDPGARAALAHQLSRARLARGDLDAAEAHALTARAATAASAREQPAAAADRGQELWIDLGRAQIATYRGDARARDALLAEVTRRAGARGDPTAIGAARGAEGEARLLAGDLVGAEPLLRRAIDAIRAGCGEACASGIEWSSALAHALARAGRCADAAAVAAPARAIASRKWGEGSAMAALFLLVDGECELGAGRAARAVAALARARAAAGPGPATLLQLPHTDFALARAYAATGDRAAALGAARRAHAGLARLPGARAARDEVADWLAAPAPATHRPPRGR